MTQLRTLRSDLFGDVRVIYGDEGGMMALDRGPAAAGSPCSQAQLVRHEARISALIDPLPDGPTLFDDCRTGIERLSSWGCYCDKP